MSPCLPQNCLHIICTLKCLSVTKRQQLSDTTNSQSSTYEVQSFVKYITDTQQLFITDILLWNYFLDTNVFTNNSLVEVSIQPSIQVNLTHQIW